MAVPAVVHKNLYKMTIFCMNVYLWFAAQGSVLANGALAHVSVSIGQMAM